MSQSEEELKSAAEYLRKWNNDDELAMQAIDLLENSTSLAQEEVKQKIKEVIEKQRREVKEPFDITAAFVRQDVQDMLTNKLVDATLSAINQM